MYHSHVSPVSFPRWESFYEAPATELGGYFEDYEPAS